MKVNLLRLLAEVTRKETTMEKLREIISVDIAISYKLMRFLNSAYFYRLQEVRTVKHASCCWWWFRNWPRSTPVS